MPVVSPSRYTPTSSNLTGSYRSTLTSSSTLDKPYYRSSSGTYVTSTLRTTYGDRTTEYRSRYSDVDGKRERKTSLVEYSRSSRAPSVTESDNGVSSRYRSERSESRSRDVSTTRSESSRTSDHRPKRNVLTSAALAMSTAELYNKYSPANYVPLTQRLQQSQNCGEISRSKSISNDIGRPPAPELRIRKPRNSAATILEKPEGRRYKESSPSPSFRKRNSVSNGVKDTNGNEVPTVSEIRKRFDGKIPVTKLPANDSRYNSSKTVEQYLTQLKDCENGTVSYTKILPKEETLVPIHLPSEKNGLNQRWETSPNRNSSSSEITLSKTLSEPVSLAKPSVDKTMTVSLTAKLPSDKLTTSIKNQLDPNNPIGKILEKSTVIHVENGDVDYTERRKLRNSPEVKLKDLKNDIEKQVKAPKHTSNFASYIQISQPIASGTSTKVNEDKDTKVKVNLKHIDSDEDRLALEEIESPSETGFENKTFEHENYLKKRTEKSDEPKDDGVKSMETSTESTISEPTDDSSSETTVTRRRILDTKDYDDIKAELAGGKSGPSGLRRSSERREPSEQNDRHSSTTSGLNGLRNIGNTCFMNSVVQCLSNTRPLLEYVTQEKYTTEINTSLSCMKGALMKGEHICKGIGEKDSVVNTTTLKSQVQRFAPRFMGYSQQDAQEFLRYLLEGLHEDVNRYFHFSDTAKANEAWSRYVRMEDSRVGDIFMATATCSKCGVRRKFSPTERFRGKLNVLVEFPLNGLDMSPLSANNTTATYNLYALSNHSGTTYSGHYTAYCKHPYSGDWHEYNDSRRTCCSTNWLTTPSRPSRLHLYIDDEAVMMCL
ncbi:unnamed protein product [Leptidea sinapis]|uniref:Ubiquitin carboxyl-terminal hydrolase n=1 Tax=Leptidea sinapis TaxID=189913 RepID=A0A5E4QFL8_9NEOP|nr:unnamed protein product [Leptidea sinapis]